MHTDSCNTKELVERELSGEHSPIIPDADLFKMEKLIESTLSGDYIPIPNDAALLEQDDSRRLKERNYKYTALLSEYVEHTKQLLKGKMLLKKIFFWVSVGLLIVFSLLFFIAVFIFGNKGQVESLTVILPATVAYLTTFIVIPQIISKYLFNEQEETNISEIIKSIQEYDKSIRNRLK